MPDTQPAVLLTRSTLSCVGNVATRICLELYNLDFNKELIRRGSYHSIILTAQGSLLFPINLRLSQGYIPCDVPCKGIPVVRICDRPIALGTYPIWQYFFHYYFVFWYAACPGSTSYQFLVLGAATYLRTIFAVTDENKESMYISMRRSWESYQMLLVSLPSQVTLSYHY